MQSIFEIHNYRQILKESLMDKKATYGRAYSYEKMAIKCRVQRAYLSTVLNGNGHLNSDQVFMACKYLAFSNKEYEYISLLHESERSVFEERTSVLKRKISKMRAKALTTSEFIETADESTPSMDEFYLDINAQLIHMFLTVPDFKNDIRKIMALTNTNPESFETSLQKMKQAGLIEIEGDDIKVIKEDFHLPPTSPLYPTYRSQMRLTALSKMQSQPVPENYNFSVLFSSCEEVRRLILKDYLDLIARAQKSIGKHKTAEVYQINFDLIKWS